VNIECNKIIEYINKIFGQEKETKANINQDVILDSIFKNAEAIENFNNLVDYLKIDRKDINKRGNQAKFSGIWSCTDSNKILFKEFTELKEYLEFVNNEFHSKWNSKSFSDGSKYHTDIKNWLK
jgi:hypothetical protein